MSNGGYILFDCMGLDLSSDSEQTKTGIHKAALNAIALHKPIYAVNCNYDGALFSPVPVTVHMSGTTVIASANVLQMFITEEDVCTVQNLVSN